MLVMKTSVDHFTVSRQTVIFAVLLRYFFALFSFEILYVCDE